MAASLLFILLATGGIVSGAATADGGASFCQRASPAEAILGSSFALCPSADLSIDVGRIGVVEGDESTLLKAVNHVQKNAGEYIAVLFYASWCPFSKVCKPNFEKLATLYPSIRHFAFEESTIRPSMLSRYGVHGFPTLFLLNSTMRIRYHGSRNVQSLAGFYSDITGINASIGSMYPDKIKPAEYFESQNGEEHENCPFWWARSPEKILEQDTYLALAVAFVVLRLLYLLVPVIKSFAMWIWRRHLRFASLMQLLEFFCAYFARGQQGKRANLHEGAMSATAWASKSLASVSIGEPSSILTSSSVERR